MNGHDQEKLDLGLLDPARQELRWERMVRSVAARGAAGAARRRPGFLSAQLAAWLRPALACAAAAALVAWVPSWLHLGAVGHPGATAAAGVHPGQADRLAAWASGEDGATALLLALGDDDDAL